MRWINLSVQIDENVNLKPTSLPLLRNQHHQEKRRSQRRLETLKQLLNPLPLLLLLLRRRKSWILNNKRGELVSLSLTT